jgi:uncharacterized protein YbaP (TraB family)
MAKTALRALGFLIALLFAAPVLAAGDTIRAHPALWHVKGPQGDVYLFGSIHVLPRDIDWRTPAVAKAMARADVFVFEVPTDPGAMRRMRDLIATHGYLPQGERLRAKLSPAEQAEFDTALAAAHLPPAAVDRDRPWLAALQIAFAEIVGAKYDPGSGVDAVVHGEAAAAGKPMRYFEYIDQQFALLAPDDPALELSEFKSDLKDLAEPDKELGALVAAWSRGEVPAIGKLMNQGLQAYPGAKKALLDDRNRRWSLQIETMLEEKRTFFITVGAGHLAGPVGVPALLRKAGYTVEGP